MTNALIKYSVLTEVISKPDSTYFPNSTVVHFKTLTLSESVDICNRETPEEV